MLGAIAWLAAPTAQGENSAEVSAARRALELLEGLHNEIEALSPYQFSIRVSDVFAVTRPSSSICRSPDKPRSSS